MRITIKVGTDIYINIDTEDQYVDSKVAESDDNEIIDEMEEALSSVSELDPPHEPTLETDTAPENIAYSIDPSQDEETHFPESTSSTIPSSHKSKSGESSDKQSVKQPEVRNAGGPPDRFAHRSTEISDLAKMNALAEISITDEETEMDERLFAEAEEKPNQLTEGEQWENVEEIDVYEEAVMAEEEIRANEEIPEHPPILYPEATRGVVPDVPANVFDAGPVSEKVLEQIVGYQPESNVVEADDLTVIEGIGPRYAQLLHQANIQTYEELMNSSIIELREMLSSAGYGGDPTTWAEQASLAAAEKWEELEQLQEELRGGRRMSTDV